MSAIPDRWIPYKACGNVIEGTRFICFKVPLKKSIQTKIRAIKEIWDIPALLNKIPNLGAVIDLTNTRRYYNPAEFQAAGVLYKKILMPGRVIPAEHKVTEFMDAIDEFLGKDGESLIGIHCTHGLNRTGYMVCRYMRDRLGVPAKDAIKRFENARGYPIERDIFIADLLGKASIKSSDTQGKYETEALRQRDRFNKHNQTCRCSRTCSKYKYSSNRRYNNSYDSRSSGNDCRNYNWRDRGSHQSNCRNKNYSDRTEQSRERPEKRRTSSESSDSSFDFKYDY
ncbi:unnamed protein product [Arctia plantaginis]|uniref:Tyrosine specific protein phosphatases domain-containing protein n=1 Tax=Arctia plantaginis TaxID=874455 RepID=A0A8S1B9X8_ARCPL|nr:unnamed protein product [Arctia plantaginis]